MKQVLPGDELKLRISLNVRISSGSAWVDPGHLADRVKDVARSEFHALLEAIGMTIDGTYDGGGWTCPKEGCLFNLKDAEVR